MLILRLINRYGEKKKLSCKLFENLLDASGSVLPDDEWLEPLINTLYYPVVYAQYGYAITVHKAQGGVWNTVFFDTEFYQNIKTKAGFNGCIQDLHWLRIDCILPIGLIWDLNYWEQCHRFLIPHLVILRMQHGLKGLLLQLMENHLAIYSNTGH